VPKAELIQPRSLNIGGVIYHQGVPKEVDFPTALDLDKSPRFNVTGLNTREAVEYQERQTRPVGAALSEAIKDAMDRLDVDDDDSFDRVGKPAIGALGKILGYPITTSERDKAMGSVDKAPQAGEGLLDTAEIKATAARKSTIRVTKEAAPAPAADEQKVAL
jgi:hypothetical protein